MKFDFNGQTYEVSEDNVIFTCNENDDITGLEFREPVKQKPRWRVSLTTRKICTMDTKVLFESDDPYDCRVIFDTEKKRLVEQLITTEDTYRLRVTSSYTPSFMSFSVTDDDKDVKYYLRLVKD